MTDTVWKCALAGEYDLSSSERLSALTADFRLSLATDAVVDCSQVTFMDSTGLKFFIQLYKAANDRGGSVRLVGPGPFLTRVLAISGLEKILTLEPLATELGADDAP